MWRPVISTAPTEVQPNNAISLTGTQFKGISEASGGATNNSATNYPLVQLRRIDNERIQYLQPSTSSWSDTHFTSVPLESSPLHNYQAGPALLTVITNGIPSESRIVTLKGSVTSDAMLRGTAAEWLGRSIHPLPFKPTAYYGVYIDVAGNDYNADWIQQLYDDLITQGCDDGNTLCCPKGAMTKTEAVKLILRTKHGGAYTPPAPSPAPLYADVPLTRACFEKMLDGAF
jgi:hypothetical protein